MKKSSPRMGIILKGEHILADVSAMMLSELRHHCNHYLICSKSYLRDVFPQLPVQPSTKCTRTDTLNSDPFLIFDGTCHKKNHKPTATPPLTVIDVAENHYLPPFDSLELVPLYTPGEWGTKGGTGEVRRRRRSG